VISVEYFVGQYGGYAIILTEPNTIKFPGDPHSTEVNSVNQISFYSLGSHLVPKIIQHKDT
jgi:hypothetical protein